MARNEDANLDERVRQIVGHGYRHSPATRRRMEAAGLKPEDILSAAELAKLPVLSKDELVRMQAEDPPFGGMLAVPHSELKWIFFSPGPLYEGVSDDDAAIADAAEWLAEVGFEAGDVVLNSMSYHLVPFGVQIDGGVRRLGGTVLPTGAGNSELQVKMMLDHGATAYVGTPSFLMTLIQKAEEAGIDFRERAQLAKALVTAEPLPPSLRETLEGYGLQVANLYGTAELGPLGFEVEAGKGFKRFDRVYVQVCDPERGDPLPDGEVGEIVATNFNRAYPLIRLGTGDLSRVDGETGNLMGWLGRTGEAVKVRGMFVHPNQLSAVMSRVPEVRSYQAVVTRPAHRDEFTLKVELADPAADREALTETLIESVPSVCRVRPDHVEFVEPGTITEGQPGIVDERSWE